MSSSRPPRFFPLFVAVLALVIWFVAWEFQGARDPLNGYTRLTLISLGASETAFYATATLVQATVTIALVAWLAPRWKDSIDRRLRELFAKPRAAMSAFAFLAVVASLAVAFLAVNLHTLNEDEKTYLFQAKLLLLGKLTISVPPEAWAFREPFIVGSSNWSGQYFWGQPALLMLGILVGLPWIVSAIEVGAIVFFSARFAEEVTEDPRVGVTTAALLAISPLVILTGGSLNNVLLAAACTAISLWALARLNRRWSAWAAIALGVSTGVAIHNRPLDHGVVLVGAAIAIAFANGKNVGAVVKRLLPAVAITIPFFVLMLLTNKAVTGDALHSGYFLFNENHGYKTFGFGLGPFGDPHTPAIAASKTLANAVRASFFVAGGPLVLAPFALAVFFGRARRLHLAAFVTVLLYVGAYFLYAASPINTTGPIYYLALMPLAAAWIAYGTLSFHDRLASIPSARRAVPALLVTHALASFVIFWPSECREVARASRSARRCDDMASAIEGRVLVFVSGAVVPQRSWTGWPPMPSPTFDDRVLFPRAQGPELDAVVAARYGEGRRIFLAQCVREESALVHYDPVTGQQWPVRYTRNGVQ